MSNRCVCCNDEIPEGSQVCINCSTYVHEVKREDSTFYVNETSHTPKKEVKQRMIICLEGCDDSTIFDMYLSNDEIDLVKKMSELSQKHSEYSCMPVMSICTYEEASDWKKNMLEYRKGNAK